MARASFSLLIKVSTEGDPVITCKWTPTTGADRDELLRRVGATLAFLGQGKLNAGIVESVLDNPDAAFGNALLQQTDSMQSLIDDLFKSEQPVVPATEVFRDG